MPINVGFYATATRRHWYIVVSFTPVCLSVCPSVRVWALQNICSYVPDLVSLNNLSPCKQSLIFDPSAFTVLVLYSPDLIKIIYLNYSPSLICCSIGDLMNPYYGHMLVTLYIPVCMYQPMQIW